MTDAQIRKMAKQLRAGADGYRTLRRAVDMAMVGDGPAITRARENMERLHRELEELAGRWESENPPSWIRAVKP